MKLERALRLIPAGLLGVGAALLVSCGSSGKGLIPLGDAGPLQRDFQAVLRAAQEGNGSCTATDAAIRKTEHDLQTLPSTVDSGLRGRLAEGVANLSVQAHTLCAQLIAQTTTTETAATATSPPTTTTTTPTTGTTGGPTTTTTPTTSQPEGEEGGTQAPGAGNNGNGNGNGNGRVRGEAGEDGGQGNGGEQAGGTGEPGGATGGTGSGR